MSRKQGKSVEEQVNLVRQYLGGKIGIRQAARMGGVDEETVKAWIRNYEAEGVSAFLPHKNKVYSQEVKRRAVESYLAGEGSLSDICKRYGIRERTTLRSWIKVYNGGGNLGSVKHSGGGSYMKQGRETTRPSGLR